MPFSGFVFGTFGVRAATEKLVVVG